jgi:hypothetical protein
MAQLTQPSQPTQPMQLPSPWLSTLSHVAQIVPVLTDAMEHYTDAFGLEWAPVMRSEAAVRSGTGELSTAHIELTWSLTGPVHVELIQESPGSVWDRTRGHPIHHLAYWVADLDQEAARLQASGFHLEATRDGPCALNGFGYFIGLEGLRVEPKPESTRPALDRWLAGGSLYD